MIVLIHENLYHTSYDVQIIPYDFHIPIVHVNPASIGVVVSSRSCPYRHRPASRRKLSRGPSPAISTAGSRSKASVMATTSEVGIEICDVG